MKIDHKLFDMVLRNEIAWHKTRTSSRDTGYTHVEKKAFIGGLKQARALLAKLVKVQREEGRAARHGNATR